jgi:hypothetical protein
VIKELLLGIAKTDDSDSIIYVSFILISIATILIFAVGKKKPPSNED